MLVNKRIIVTISVLGAASLLLIGAGVIPTVLSISELELKINNQNIAIEKRYAARQQVRDTLTALEDNKSTIAGLKHYAVIEGEELNFVSALEGVQERTGIDADISLETVNQRDLSTWEREIPIRLTMTGDYADILRFIEGVERLPYLVVIDRLGLSGTNVGSVPKPGLVRVELNGSVYWISKLAPTFVDTGTVAPPTER